MKGKGLQRRSRFRSSNRVGLARYRKDEWSRWLELADDRENWHDTYDEWLVASEAMAQRLRGAGLEVIWVDLDADEFATWCRSRGYKNDAEARSRFAAEQIGNIPPPVV